MIAILIAMEQEFAGIKQNIEILRTETFNKVDFHFFNLNGNEYVVALTGVGTVKAAVITTILCSKYNVDYIINMGTVGGVHKDINALDLILVNKAINSDFHLTYQKEPGESTYPVTYHDIGGEFFGKFQKKLEDNNIEFKVGTISSGSSFMTVESIKSFEIIQEINSYCYDMEIAGILVAAEKFDVPVIAFKYVSDTIYLKNSEITFWKNLETISFMMWDLLKTIG